MGEIALAKPVHVKHTNEKTQGFSFFFPNVFYSIHLSIVGQSYTVWERRERDKGLLWEGLYLVGTVREEKEITG